MGFLCSTLLSDFGNKAVAVVTDVKIPGLLSLRLCIQVFVNQVIVVLFGFKFSSTMYVQFNYKYCVPMLMAGQTIALGITCELAQGCYPVCVCTAGLCVWSCRFVYIYKYIRKPTRRVCVQKTGCVRSCHLKISCWCNLLVAH